MEVLNMNETITLRTGKKISEIVEENPEGFSIDIKTMSLINPDSLNKGYIVGVTNNSGVSKTFIDVEFKRLLKCASLISADNVFIGGWRDSETNKFYLDVSIWVDDNYKAEMLKNVFKQKAIFNLNKWSSE
jgi:hypothetical protein